MKKIIVISIVLLMLAGFAITSSAQPVTVILFAGQTLDVGTLTVAVDGTNLVVTYTMNPWNSVEGGWELLETHLYVGTAAPDKSAPGRFPYGPEHDYILSPGVYTIPLDDFKTNNELPESLFIAAHAEIGEVYESGEPVLDDDEEQIEETAWALDVDGIPIGKGKNWAEYFEFDLDD